MEDCLVPFSTSHSPSLSSVISPALLDELDEKLRLKFEISTKDVALVRSKLESIAEIVRPEMVLHVIEDDPDDDRVLECALAGEANYVVTGDRHLLKLGLYESVPIITVRQFLDTFPNDLPDR